MVKSLNKVKITVNGNFLNSTFGSSIEALVQMHGPIREVPVANLLEIVSMPSYCV